MCANRKEATMETFVHEIRDIEFVVEEGKVRLPSLPGYHSKPLVMSGRAEWYRRTLYEHRHKYQKCQNSRQERSFHGITFVFLKFKSKNHQDTLAIIVILPVYCP